MRTDQFGTGSSGLAFRCEAGTPLGTGALTESTSPALVLVERLTVTCRNVSRLLAEVKSRENQLASCYAPSIPLSRRRRLDQIGLTRPEYMNRYSGSE